jgi:large subunit ribosomal protein L22
MVKWLRELLRKLKMEAIAVHKYLRMSPQKVRLVVGMVKPLTPQKALEVLPHIQRAASRPVAKVIASAVANAKQKGASEADLVFKEIQVTRGPILKRGRPVGRGRWHPIQKKSSHVRVVVTDQKEKGKNGSKD